MTRFPLKFLLVILLIGCQERARNERLSHILGIEYIEIKRLESKEIFGGFGEGYTIETYKLPTEAVKMYLEKSSKILPDNKNKLWKKYDWHASPASDTSSVNGLLALTLNYFTKDNDLKNTLKEIKERLKKPGTYFAIYYKPDLKDANGAELFVLDSFNRILYIISSQI